MYGSKTWPAAQGRQTRLRAAVVGVGRQALEDHIPGLLACDGAELVAICDENPEVVREQQYRLRVPGYTDFQEMFKAEQPDFVVVCVPHHAGREVIEAAAAQHIHVLKEKPFAASMEEARELAETCGKAGIELMVTLQRRFNPVYASFLQLADQIGTPFMADAQYTLHVPDPSEGWRGTAAKAGGGCVIDMGYHLIDMILWYFGQPDRVPGRPVRQRTPGPGLRRRGHRPHPLRLRQRPVRLPAHLAVHRAQAGTDPAGGEQGHRAAGARPDPAPRQQRRDRRVPVPRAGVAVRGGLPGRSLLQGHRRAAPERQRTR